MGQGLLIYGGDRGGYVVQGSLTLSARELHGQHTLPGNFLRDSNPDSTGILPGEDPVDFYRGGSGSFAARCIFSAACWANIALLPCRPLFPRGVQPGMLHVNVFKRSTRDRCVYWD